MKDPVSGIYRHFKGNRYFVIGTARRPYLEEKFVIYRALYGDHLDFARPLGMFLEHVTRDGHDGPRFALVDGSPMALEAFGIIRYDEAFLPVLHTETHERLFVHRGLFGSQDLIIRPQEELRYALEGDRP